METAMRKEIDELSTMPVSQLRQKYLEVFGEESRSNHKQFLFRRIVIALLALGLRALDDELEVLEGGLPGVGGGEDVVDPLGLDVAFGEAVVVGGRPRSLSLAEVDRRRSRRVWNDTSAPCPTVNRTASALSRHWHVFVPNLENSMRGKGLPPMVCNHSIPLSQTRQHRLLIG